jgi:hypothetical protein
MKSSTSLRAHSRVVVGPVSPFINICVRKLGNGKFKYHCGSVLVAFYTRQCFSRGIEDKVWGVVVAVSVPISLLMTKTLKSTYSVGTGDRGMYKEPWPMFITGWIGELAIALFMMDLNARFW